jgi:hypothetical protein
MHTLVSLSTLFLLTGRILHPYIVHYTLCSSLNFMRGPPQQCVQTVTHPHAFAGAVLTAWSGDPHFLVTQMPLIMFLLIWGQDTPMS